LIQESAAQRIGRNVTVTAIASCCLALVSLAVLAALGQLLAGIALALGLVLGGANGFLVKRTLRPGVPFSAVSLGRIALLSVIGLGIGFLLGASVAWLVIVGIGVSQLVLAGMNAYEVLHG
jgi:hypothetical protein